MCVCAAPSNSLEQHFVQLIRGRSGEEERSSHHSSFCTGKHLQTEPNNKPCQQIEACFAEIFVRTCMSSKPRVRAGLKRKEMSNTRHL